MSSADKDVSLLLVALDRAETELQRGEVSVARGLLTGLEARLLVAGLQSHLPRFFRVAGECEWQEGNLDEAARLIQKGLVRLTSADDQERQPLVSLGRRVLEALERQPGSNSGI